jgi:aquaporin Z
LQQLWLFWLAPIIGGLIGGFVYKALGAERANVQR